MAPPLSSTERSRRWRASGKGRVDDRRRAALSNPRRVWVGGDYVGSAPTAEIAQSINDETRREFRGRKNTRAEEG